MKISTLTANYKYEEEEEEKELQNLFIIFARIFFLF